MTSLLSRIRGVDIPLLQKAAPDPVRSTALLVHGIFSEKTEDGRYSRLVEELASDGVSSWRFDYVGHGENPRSSRDFTVAAALADFLLVAKAHKEMVGDGTRVLIASSFGGSLVLLSAITGDLAQLGYDRIVLLNPVTDYRSTFLEPFGQQMQEIFTADALTAIRTDGEAEVQPGFVLGLPALLEFELLRPAEGFPLIESPILVLHGDQDTAVSHDVVKHDSSMAPDIEYHTIHGAAHAFADPPYERETFDLVRTFLS